MSEKPKIILTASDPFEGLEVHCSCGWGGDWDSGYDVPLEDLTDVVEEHRAKCPLLADEYTDLEQKLLPTVQEVFGECEFPSENAPHLCVTHDDVRSDTHRALCRRGRDALLVACRAVAATC